MKQIDSPHNAIFKNLKALATNAKARREQNKVILEGIHLTHSYLLTGQLPVSCVVSRSAEDNWEVSTIITRCEQQGIPIVSVNDSQFEALSSVDNGVGVLLVIEQPVANTPEVLAESALLLDDVQDPGNVGTILRTAAAAGLTAVYCSPQTAALWSPKVLRAAMGAHFVLKTYENVDLSKVIESATVPIYATTLQAKKSIYEVDLSGEVAWIVGNEGQGVSTELLGKSVEQVIIPQNSEVESLNVAAATAVCVFEQRRQRTA